MCDFFFVSIRLYIFKKLSKKCNLHTKIVHVACNIWRFYLCLLQYSIFFLFCLSSVQNMLNICR